MDHLRSATHQAARAFLEGVWPVLIEERVLPVARHARHLRVGKDYYGPSIRAQVDAFEEMLQTNWNRFSESVPHGQREFASTYVFTFLEFCLAQVALERDGVTLSDEIVNNATRVLCEALDRPEEEVVCLRSVSHLTTSSGDSLTVGDVEVLPVTGAAHSQRDQVARIHEASAYGAGSFVDRNADFMYAPPESIVVARATSTDPHRAGMEASKAVSEFLNAIRLLFAATSQGPFEVRGGVAPVRRCNLELVEFVGERPGLMSHTAMVRRTTVMRLDDVRQVESLRSLIASLPDLGEGMHFTSLGLASHKFTMSYHPHRWWDQLVDLTTALEGALSGKDKTDVLLRLRTRAAALLATKEDPAGDIFGDLGVLYGLRSSLIHGGDLKTAALQRSVMRVSSVPPTAPFSLAIAFAMDRLRDLVRRSLLCRYALGSEGTLWPVSGNADVDALLADDATRKVWRSTWRGVLADIGAAAAAERARAAMDHLTREDDDR